MNNILTSQNIALVLFFIGIYGLITKKNMIKSIISINIMQLGTILYFLSIADRQNATAPIVGNTDMVLADPLPHALMITAIVIGVGVTALSLSIVIRLYQIYGTLSWDKLIKRRNP